VIEVPVQRDLPYSDVAGTGWWDVPVPEYLTKARQRYERERREERLA
jgi:hypothetical protein